MARALLLFFLLSLCSHAQQTAPVVGKTIDSRQQEPLAGAKATLQDSGRTATTSSDGFFVLPGVPEGEHLLTVSYPGFVSQSFRISIIDGRPIDLGTILLEEDRATEQQSGLITLTDSDLGDSGGSEATAALLQATRDAFQQAAAFSWGPARFRMRGLDSGYGITLINGIAMNRLYDGRPQWANWGGLNDATRHQEFTTGTAPSDLTFGSLLGTQAITARASAFRRGTRLSFAGTSTFYSYRAMATHASGMNSKGFAYAVSASRRGGDGYFEGTGFDGNSFFVSMEKRMSDRHSLNLTGMYAKSIRGRNSPNTQEATNIAGIRYNSYWGPHNGKQRNSREKDVEEPFVILSHYWKLSGKATLNTNIAYQFGHIGNSRIDYQFAPSPDPAYYRYMPGYFDDPARAAAASFFTQRQVNWDALYTHNATAPGGRSSYVHYEDRTDDQTFSVNSLLHTRLSQYITLNAGAGYRRLASHSYQRLLDLLGGRYYLDIDPFYSGDAAQADLNNPDRRVSVGDTFGYNYKLFANVLDAFTQFRFVYGRTSFYLAQSYSRSAYEREGLYRNGLYPGNSQGRSPRMVFENFGFKGGIAYAPDGRHFFAFNVLRMTKAPSLRNAFANARLNNTVMEGIGSEVLSSADMTYILRLPRLQARFTGFYATVHNAAETSSFYGEGLFEGDDSDAFVAENVTGIHKIMMGVEMGVQYKLLPVLTATAAAAIGQYTYGNNPQVTLNNDALSLMGNDGLTGSMPGTTIDFGRAYLRNYRLPGMPQQAFSLGLEYRDPHYWWAGINTSYLAGNYIDVSALLRTEHFFRNTDSPGNAFENIDPQRARQLLRQEKFDPLFLLNLTGGKSWKVKKTIFGFFASINNVLDTTYKTGGFEQSRNTNYAELSEDLSGTPSFGPRYYYGYGRTYYINLYINL